MRFSLSLLALAALASSASARRLDGKQRLKRASDCTGTISSLDDVADAIECSTVNIESFTVDSGETLDLDLVDGATVNLRSSFLPFFFLLSMG
jgi:hypothetical protein